MAVVTYNVPDISCEGCANAIKRSIGTLSGVRDVNVDVPTKVVTVDFDDSAIQQTAIAERIEDAGYEVANT